MLPSVFHRIRHYGLLANAGHRDHLAQIRELLPGAPAHAEPKDAIADAAEKVV